MDRLTTRNPDGTIGVGHPLCYYNYEHIVQVLNRLAAYEDTGLTPEEIQQAVDLFKDWRNADIPKELKSWVERCTWHVRKCEELRRELDEYKKAEAEGRLLILPCKVGDTVYQHDNVRIYQSIITSIIITDSRLLYHTTSVGFDETAIGGSIFLTRAEAEAALNCCWYKPRKETL